MSLKSVGEFFENTVIIQLKDGHRFEGLLSRVDYKKQEIQLENVEDLGNDNDKHSIPHDKKIESKVFERETINEIIFKEKHFAQPKKYQQKDFWDPVSDEPVKKKTYEEKRPYNNNQNNYKGNYKGNNYQGNNYQNNNYRQNQYRENDSRRGGERGDRNRPNNYEQKREVKEDEYR